MSDSDDFGDVDDTEFLAVATQVERATSSFRPSPRPQKRRRIQSGQRIPTGKASELSGSYRQALRDGDSHLKTVNPAPCSIGLNLRKRIIHQDDSDSEAFDPAPCSTTFTPRRRAIFEANQSSKDLDPGQSPGPTSVSTSGKRKRGRPRKDKENQEPGRGSATPSKKIAKRRADRIHVPNHDIDLADVTYTQPAALGSSPGKLRGPIWKKPKPQAHNSSNGLARTPSLPSQRPTIGTQEGDDDFMTMRDAIPRRMNASAQASQIPFAKSSTTTFDAAQELADLPSDAFASSSSPQKQQDDVIFLSSQMSPASRGRLAAPQTGLRQTTLFGRAAAEAIPPSQVNKRFNFVSTQRQEPPTHHKLNDEAMKTWVYPTNLGSTRDYQFNIVARGLFHNLLVALPTGLGKTFIAATIMLNWFRWTKDAQIVFVAPTKPLVSQQVEACFGVAGIPRSQTSMLTGGVSPGIRAEEWADKRVFFMTPQTLINDLKTGICDPKRLVLIVVDEAHRATGGYAYVEVVKFVRRFNESFRVLALTATPGSDVESVQKVIDGLDIAKVEIRTENSLDIRGYVHKRKIEKHVFDNSEEMEMCMVLYADAVRPVLSKLNGMNAYWSKDPLRLTPYGCTQSRQQWFASDAGRSASFPVKSMVNNIFAILASLSHSMELLKYHGMGPFYTKLREFKESNEESKSKYKREICDNKPFSKLMARLHTWVNNDTFIGHPKLDFLQEVILEHFVNASEGRRPDGAPPSETRIMVFAHFRDSAEEIVRKLKRHQPMIRPHVFVGQASAKNSDGMDQRMQLEVIEKFKKGVFNTLVATSIGEEGLDIGEVDLIICYDSKASPIRMLQRMGRTGRKREGKIILLQMKGKEEDDATKAKDNYEKMQEMIAKGSRFAFHDDRSRRIIPRNVQPVVDQRPVEIPLENSQLELPEPKRRNGRAPKRPPKKFHMPDNVITGFMQVSRMGDPDGGVVMLRSRGRPKKSASIHPSEEALEMEPLDSVLLTTEETKDLVRKYQTVFDDDEEMVGALNLKAHPTRQRILSRTRYFGRPGRAAVSMVKMLRRMHGTNANRLEQLKRKFHDSDLEDDILDGIVVSEEEQVLSKPLPKPRVKQRPKPNPTTTKNVPSITIQNVSDSEDEVSASPPPLPPPKGPPRTTATTNKVPAKPRGRPRKTTTTPSRCTKTTPKSKSQSYRISDLVDEGASSSPPPTDPRMRIASQAVSLGSEDTSGSEDQDDPRLASDLEDFIADDEEEVQVYSSSLPQGGLGRKKTDQVRARDLFTSDDIEGVEDADEGEVPFYGLESSSSTVEGEQDRSVRQAVGKKKPVVADLDASEDDGPIAKPRQRGRRVIVDDEDEDE